MASMFSNLSGWIIDKITRRKGSLTTSPENFLGQGDGSKVKNESDMEIIPETPPNQIPIARDPNGIPEYEGVFQTEPQIVSSTPLKQNRRLLSDEVDGYHPPQYNVDTNHSVRIKEKEPQKYSGKSDWKDYLRQFKAVALWNQWDEERMGLQLAMSLTDEALEVWGSLPENVCYDFYVLTDALTRRFSPHGQESQYSLELMNRTCQPDETVTTYGHALRRLASRAYPGQLIQEEILVNLYTKGLNNKEMKRYVYLSKPKTLAEAINLAVSFEAFENPIGKSKKPKPVVASVCDATSKGSLETNDSLPKLLTDFSATLNQVNKTLNQCGKLITDKKSRKSEKKRVDVECYKCHAKGHYARECPMPNEGENLKQRAIPKPNVTPQLN